MFTPGKWGLVAANSRDHGGEKTKGNQIDLDYP
jgi:hypothetical protein